MLQLSDGLLLDTVHIIDIVSSCEEIEDRRTPDTVILCQIQVIADLLDDLSLAQHMAVVFVIFQAVDVGFNSHNRPPTADK